MMVLDDSIRCSLASNISVVFDLINKTRGTMLKKVLGARYWHML